MDLKNMKTEELLALQEAIQKELNNRSGKVIVELGYHKYKGTGKCWVAEIDPATKKKLGFVDAVGHEYIDKYRGVKTFELQEGKTYELCETGTKSNDSRRIVTVIGGELK